MGNQFTDAARVDVKFCYHFSSPFTRTRSAVPPPPLPLPVACFSYIRFKEPFYTYAPFTLSQTFIQNTVRFNAKPNHFDDFFGHNFVFPAGGSVLRRSLKAWLQRTYSTWA